ncbi:MAG: F0F1 ATP synthase subunit epsilon [Actinomycetota bacterium]|nr:F0F1 ATP synthase subunit epsilon [Actinomycetota bacterium]
MAEMAVEVVAVEKRVWSGEAQGVFARTTEGELGVLPGHAPLLGELVTGGIVRIKPTDGEQLTIAVHGGFLSVTGEKVSVLAETAELADEIDIERAREALRRAESDSDSDAKDVEAARSRATARIEAAGQGV